MKSTDMARKERDLKKALKKDEVLARKQAKGGISPGDYIKNLYSLFFHDTERIYNVDSSEEILELLLEMKEDLEDKQWDNVIRKAVRKTKVTQREEAIQALKDLADIS